MTINESIDYLWELGGEQSDLDPWSQDGLTLDVTSFGYKYFLKQLNKAQMTLANWRTRRGRPIRFKKFLTRKNIKLGLLSPTSTGVTYIDEYTLKITDPPTFDPDYYINTKLDITITDLTDSSETVQDRVAVMVEDYEGLGTSLYFTFMDPMEGYTGISQSLKVDFYFTAFKLVRSSVAGTGFSANLPTRTRNITSIMTLADGKVLSRAEEKTRLYDYAMSEGTPAQWYHSGEVIYFDTYIGEQMWFTFFYQRLPNELTATDTMFDIPLEWEDVILMLVEMESAKRSQDNERATILRSQINSLIDQLRTDAEEEWIEEDTQGFYVQMEAKS